VDTELRGEMDNYDVVISSVKVLNTPRALIIHHSSTLQ